MPPRRRKAQSNSNVKARPRRSTRQATKGSNGNTSHGIPDVFQDMLDEAAAASADEFTASPRPLKKQKVTPNQTGINALFDSPPAASPELEEFEDVPIDLNRPQQIIYDDFEGSDESDVEFEDVELEAAAATAHSASEDETVEPKPIQIDLSKSVLETPKRAIQRRKPVTKAERSMRLDVHKWHLLSLIGHGLQRNAWCNNQEVHALLKPTVPRKTIKLLHSDEAKPMYERNYSFNKGIEEICDLWHHRWKTTIQGLRRPYWREAVDAMDEIDDSEDLEFEDFMTAAQTTRGSRDLGAQLFTALLRSIAVEARLVFSLQVLPFAAAAKVDTPSKPRSGLDYIHAPPQSFSAAINGPSPFAPPISKVKKTKKIVDSPFPIFWTEVLTPGRNWIPLDPIVRNSISKPKTQFEPSLSDSLNSMTYVIAYEDDNSARDVTRRYAQWFNAKTRKLRVESTKNGEEWYESALNILKKSVCEPRDEIEDAELARRANSEGMPNNIQDFKNHPVYVLERHMRANEVLQPKREVGKINTGTAKNGRIESVYRRQDVHLCRTADAWYRRGRDVKVGEQSLKRVLPKSRRAVRDGSAELSDDEDQTERDGVGLYAEYQTNVYKPPPVENGMIPKNAYGNLDVYVPSMIPPGAVHISHPLAASAAKHVGVDFADAVTGFEFKGRQGTAVVNGIVVGHQSTAAISTVIDGLETLGSEEVQQARSKILLSLWKRMLQALRVREKVEAEYGPTSTSGPKKDSGDEDDSEFEEDGMDEEVGGGFMLGDEATEEKVQEQAVNLQIMKSKLSTVLPEEVVRVPIKITLSPHKIPVNEREIAVNGNLEDDDELFEDHDNDTNMAGGFMVSNDNDPHIAGGLIQDEEDQDHAGGFIADNESDQGGGFLPEDEPTLDIEPIADSTPNKPSLQSRTKPKSSYNDTFANTLLSTEKAVDRATSPTQDSSGVIDSHTVDALHSDAEEDSALQLAIAESLAPRTSTDPVAGASNAEAAGAVEVKGDDDSERVADNADAGKGKSRMLGEPDSGGRGRVEEEQEGENDSDTSLLSHDPNEDDEEPEWLNEALDD